MGETNLSVQVILDLPEDAFSILRSSPESFANEMRLAAAVKWYEMGRISQSKASALAGISRQEFIDCLSAFGVSPLQVTPEEIESDYRRA